MAYILSKIAGIILAISFKEASSVFESDLKPN